MPRSNLEIDYSIYKAYEVGELIGTGTYGEVYRLVDRRTRQPFALKKIINAFQNLIDAKRTFRQLSILKQIAHPCIVKLHAVLNVGPKPSSNTDSTRYPGSPVANPARQPQAREIFPECKKHVYALFEFVESDLQRVLNDDDSKLQPLHRKFITYQMLLALEYLHLSGLIHRDVKPSNVLVNSNCEIKLCDFGLCRLLPQVNIDAPAILTEYVASRMYRAPEVLLCLDCSPAIDLWSVGCVMAELLLKEPLFRGDSTIQQLYQIVKYVGMPSESHIRSIPSEKAQKILKGLTVRGTQNAKLTEFLIDAEDLEADLILKLLTFDPQQRLSAKAALEHPYFNEIRKLGLTITPPMASTKVFDHLANLKPAQMTLGNLRRFVQDLGINLASSRQTRSPSRQRIQKQLYSSLSSNSPTPFKDLISENREEPYQHSQTKINQDRSKPQQEINKRPQSLHQNLGKNRKDQTKKKSVHSIEKIARSQSVPRSKLNALKNDKQVTRKQFSKKQKSKSKLHSLKEEAKSLYKSTKQVYKQVKTKLQRNSGLGKHNSMVNLAVHSGIKEKPKMVKKSLKGKKKIN